MRSWWIGCTVVLAGLAGWGAAQSPSKPAPPAGKSASNGNPSVADAAVPASGPASGQGNFSDVDLVMKLLAARKQYQTQLEQLLAHYTKTGETEKARWAKEELLNYHRIPKQAYRLELDVPPPTLVAKENIPAANEIYRRAMTYKDKGYGMDYIDNQRRAELLFQYLLSEYPQSDKIGEVAYQLGDLYESRAYKQYRRAAWYFERSFQWANNTQSDARLRAARIYDRYLQERTEAIRLYRMVISHETNEAHIKEARARLLELNGKP